MFISALIVSINRDPSRGLLAFMLIITRSSRGIELHAPAGPRVERRRGFFHVLTSDTGYLYARRFILHGADARVCGAGDRYRSSPGGVKVTGGGWHGEERALEI
ncbi:hypothetical protein EVAR_78337_1 [Eumeta japonica]|uniref:Uncharacterized protein n=1 Tax=Eumeta variegata TaxID=151549 RepID=A0A4C1T6B3_EUMVA|nr:hypothetical protein EVAR_78337_1 [Eumeta japonica]